MMHMCIPFDEIWEIVKDGLSSAAHDALLDLMDNANINVNVRKGVNAFLDEEGGEIAVRAPVLHYKAQKALRIKFPETAQLGIINRSLDRFEVFVKTVGADTGVENAHLDGVAGVIQSAVSVDVVVWGFGEIDETCPLLQVLGFALGTGGEEGAGVSESVVEFVEMETGKNVKVYVDMHAAVIMTGKASLSQFPKTVFDSLSAICHCLFISC